MLVMCGRYTLYTKKDALAKTFGYDWSVEETAQELSDLYGSRYEHKQSFDNYNVAPGHFMPVVSAPKGERMMSEMKWGLIPTWAKDPKIGYKMINARADGITVKPVWRGPIKTKRCLIPSTGFYEWKTRVDDAAKQPYFIRPKKEHLFAFAGVYDEWKGSNGDPLYTYSIITTEPNKEMSKLHYRMPVILHPETWDTWLMPSTLDRGVLETLLRPYEDNGLEMWEVSRDVNYVSINSEELIKPIAQ